MPPQPFVPVPRVVRVALRAVYGDDLDVLNVFHVSGSEEGPYEPAVLHDIAAGIYNIFTATFKDALSEHITWADCTAKDNTTDVGAVSTFVPSAAVAGENAGADALPANVALVISWKESISYRGGHPRTYLCGINGSNIQDPQHVTSVFASGIQTRGNTFLTDVNAGTIDGFGTQHLVVPHIRGTGEDRHLLSTNVITGAVVNTRVDSQRRRLRR